MDEAEMEEYGGAWDDVHGEELLVELVRESRKEEVDFIQTKPVWVLRRVEECLAVTGKPHIKMRWVDTDKGFMKNKHE
eukprot:8472623-Karenia_brevis.AAC.1